MKNKTFAFPFQTSLIYAIIGALWIFFSDKVLTLFVTNLDNLNTLQTYKGWFFVLSTAIILFLILRNRLIAYNEEHSERQRAEESVVENEKRLAALIDSAMDAIIIANADQKIILFNKSAEKIFKISSDKALNQPIKIFIPGIYELNYQDPVSGIMNTTATGKGLRADGSEFPLEASISQINLKEKKLLNIILRDISERIQSENALQESEQRFSKAFHANPAAVIITRFSNGEVIDVNQSYLNILGFSREELIGSSGTKLNIFNNESERKEIIYELEQFGSVHNYETAVRTKSGNVRFVLLSIEKIELDGESCILSIFFDITESKLAEDEIIKLNDELEHRVQKRTEQLEAANKELESFSYSVSHDLRAPLRGIDSWSQALMENYGHYFDEQGKIFLSRIRSESQRMSQLIDDLLKLSRIARTEKHVVDVNLTLIAETVVSRLKENEPQRIVDVSIQPGITTSGDPFLLESALTNLLNNAFKFTGKKTNAKVEFGFSIIDDKTIYFVRDNGAGFDMNYAKQLFGAFQRMHPHSEFPGTGIGLAIVQRIIRHHGGRIWAESVVNEGTTFFFTIDEKT